MLTISQLVVGTRSRQYRYRVKKTPALKFVIRKIMNTKFLPTEVFTAKPSPQKSGRCVSVVIVAPKKPNSAQRTVARISLSNYKNIYGYIPGNGSNHSLQRSSRVFVRGGRTKDLVGLHYKIIRGKLDCAPAHGRSVSRSKYGIKH